MENRNNDAIEHELRGNGPFVDLFLIWLSQHQGLAYVNHYYGTAGVLVAEILASWRHQGYLDNAQTMRHGNGVRDQIHRIYRDARGSGAFDPYEMLEILQTRHALSNEARRGNNMVQFLLQFFATRDGWSIVNNWSPTSKNALLVFLQNTNYNRVPNVIPDCLVSLYVMTQYSRILARRARGPVVAQGQMQHQGGGAEARNRVATRVHETNRDVHQAFIPPPYASGQLEPRRPAVGSTSNPRGQVGGGQVPPADDLMTQPIESPSLSAEAKESDQDEDNTFGPPPVVPQGQMQHHEAFIPPPYASGQLEPRRPAVESTSTARVQVDRRHLSSVTYLTNQNIGSSESLAEAQESGPAENEEEVALHVGNLAHANESEPQRPAGGHRQSRPGGDGCFGDGGYGGKGG